MLDFLRKRATSWTIKIIFGLIILVFVLWGVGTMREREQNEVGRINKTSITLFEYQNAMDIVSNTYKNILGDRFDYKVLEEKIKNEAWDLIVDQTLLLNKAEELKLKVSENEIIDELMREEAFKVNGQFNRDRYLEVLRYMKTTPSAFEGNIEKSLLISKVSAIIKNSVNLSEEELKEFFRVKNREIKAGFVELNYKNFVKEVSVTPEEEKKYYDENKESFKRPETAEINYAYIKNEDFLTQIKLEEKDLKEYYDEHKSEFFVPKTYVIKHIFIAFGQDKERAKKKAEEAKKLLSKEDFSKVASKYNDDGTKKRGGEIGEVTLDKVSPKLAAKLSTMKKGELSDLVESEYGFHIIKVEDLKDERVRELAEVKEDVEKKVKFNKARLYAQKKANDIKKDLETGKDKDVSLKKAIIEKEKAEIGDIGVAPEVSKTVFSSQDGKVFGPVMLSKGVIVGKIIKINRGYFELAEVKDRVKEGLIKKKALELATKKAEELIKAGSLPKGKELGFFNPLTNIPAPLNLIKDIDKDIVKLGKNNKILGKAYTAGDNVYIIYFIDEKEKEYDPSSAEFKAFKEEFLKNKRDLYFKEWLKEERSKTKIKRNEEFFKKA